MISFLGAPLSGASTEPALPGSVYWHGRLMVLAWGVLLPLGALIARFYKITPAQNWPQQLDNKWWWYSHQAFQYLGLVVMSLGLWLVWGMAGGATPAARVHANLGWILFWAGWLQLLGALLRGTTGGPAYNNIRGDHYDMTPKRLLFERLHKSTGWVALLLSIAAIVLGLVTADAPRWMLLALIIWWVVLTGAFVRLQKAGRCVDTYQAIWGPDPRHPGNSLKPIGIGIKRKPYSLEEIK